VPDVRGGPGGHRDQWDQNDEDLADLDWVRITVTWQDGTKAETTVTPEEAWTS
jgi:hypothetical protein